MKRKPGKREPNGRLQRPTMSQLKEIEAERYREEMKQVGNQPGRREFENPLDPRLENALGRFCVLNKLRGELYDAGHEWAEIRRSWNSAKGVPNPINVGGMGSGQGPSEATVTRWKRLLDQIDEDLYEVNAATMWATRRLCIDGVMPTREFAQYVVKGLSVVAQSLGRVEANVHPFVRAA